MIEADAPPAPSPAAPPPRELSTRELALMRLLVTSALLAYAWSLPAQDDTAAGIIIGGIVAYWLPVSVDRLRSLGTPPGDSVT